MIKLQLINSMSLNPKNPTFSKTLESLKEGIAEDRLPNDPSVYFILEKLKHQSLLKYVVPKFLTLIPMKSIFHFHEVDLTDKEFILSRFAHINPLTQLLETPLQAAEIEIHSDEIYPLLSFFRAKRKYVEVLNAFKKIDELESILLILWNAGILIEREESALETWEEHDLQFHARSRIGRHHYPCGAIFPFPHLQHAPVCKAPMSDEKISLAKSRREGAFYEVLERRKSCRENRVKPLNLNILSEFLYHVGRAKEYAKNNQYSFSKRNYPSGGAMYELEIYPVIHQCEGLESGIYHYAPDHHALYRLKERNEELMYSAGLHSGKMELPKILFVITARFQRTMWKYRSVAYALILKNVGVLYQTMYLVATEMGLSPCAQGGGNSDLFGQLIGLNYYEESSVGEFILS